MDLAGGSGRSCLAIVLAAGDGTRMRSSRPKVLHPLAGQPLIAHVLAAVAEAGVDAVALVTAPGHDAVVAAAKASVQNVQIFEQTERRGTAHAVLAARAAIEAGYDDLLVLFADTPLVRAATFQEMRRVLAEAASAVVALGFSAGDPKGYGRFILEADELVAIREDKDASEAERAVRLCNGGLMALDGRAALSLLDAIDAKNAQNEYYLTDVVAAARARGRKAKMLLADESELIGVNDRIQLAAAEAVMQARLRAAAMAGGATLVDPQSTFLSFDTVLARDVTVEPHVVFGPGVSVGEGTLIRAFSHLEGARIGRNAIIGPFARLRPGAVLEADVHVGNFVEVKAAHLGQGVKANHLTYLGDAIVGAGTNIGAGTVTCNYDGFRKSKTEIGAGAFIGVHTALVAPVKVGAGAYTATGSVITAEVAPDALALARARQVEKPGWAKAFREKNKT